MTAIAAVLIRADHQALAKPDVLRIQARYRLKAPRGNDIIDILIRRLQMSQPRLRIRGNVHLTFNRL